MSNDDLAMWSYYRDKQGLVYALEGQFAEEVAGNFQLQMALTQVKMAKALINNIMMAKEERAKEEKWEQEEEEQRAAKQRWETLKRIKPQERKTNDG